MADNTTSVKITANASQFESEMRRVANVANTAGTAVTSAFKTAATNLIPILGGLSAAFTVGAFTESIAGAIKFAAALDDMAERTGATVENLSALAKVAKIGGHDLGQVEASLQKLAKALHSTDEETKGAGKALAALGLDINELRGKDTAEAMLDIAKAMDKFKDGSGKSAVAIAILGKAGAQALPFLKDLAEKSELVGKVTAEQASQAEQYEKNLVRLTSGFSSFSKTIAMEVLPVMAKFTESLMTDISSAGGFFNALKIQATLPWGNLTQQLGSVSKEIERLQSLQGKGGAAGEDYKTLGGDAALKRAQETKKFLQARQINQTLEFAGDPASNMDANDRKFARKLSLNDFVNEQDKPAKPPNVPSAGASKVDDYTKIIQMLNEKITVEQAAIDSVGKLTQAEKEFAKYQADVASGAIKMTGAQKSIADAYWEVYHARAQQKEFDAGVEKQVEATRQQTVALQDRIQALKTEADTAGLTEAAIAAMTASRLEEAIALASSRGATADQIAVMEEELAIRNKLSSAIESRDLARDLSMTKSAQAARDEAKRAAYDRALANKEISEQQHQELLDTMSKEGDAMGEFAKKAAQNMQDAMANFFIDPTQKGMKSIAQSFGEMVQKMIAQAAAAQLGKLLFGDMDKTGNLGGWLGKIFGASSTSSASSALDFSSIFDTGLFANGGIMTSAGRLPLNTYAGGGVANRPQLAMFGEGRTPEAYVPLPDGRRIPVAMQGGGASGLHQTLNFYGQAEPAQVKRAAASGARSVLGVVSGSQRYS